MTKTIFDKSIPNRLAHAQVPKVANFAANISSELLRNDEPLLPEVSELEAIRHYTQLSQKNYCIETHFYPLGSCTMKYNPRACAKLAMLPPFLKQHPLAPEGAIQGLLACLYELQEYLKAITGMAAVSLAPMAGAQGEFAGINMIRAFHQGRGDFQRNEMLVSTSAHGTNPASAAMGGFKVKEVPSTREGDIDITALKNLVGPHTAGIMLTNPSTLGIFERGITEVAKIVHEAGGLLYYDGANLNAILGKIRPGSMGFDVVHLNLHKTFATPHGGGGPGCGPVLANERLRAFLPIPMVACEKQAEAKAFKWVNEVDCPQTIGRLSTFMGNVGILLRAYVYIRLLGKEGLPRVAEYATLNANYLQEKLKAIGYQSPFPHRRATHEFVLTLAQELKNHNVSAMDVAKRLLDKGFYAPTTYFPLLIPECLLIEPTETESKQTLDEMIAAMEEIFQEIKHSPDKVRAAPSRLACKRLDEVKAARTLELTWNKISKA